MAHPAQLGFQDAVSPTMEELLHFHDHTLMFVFLVSSFVLYTIVVTVFTKLTNKYTQDSQEIEIVWTILPAMVLFLIAIPSLRVLYIIDEVSDAHLTIKAMGHQWYWTYEYSDFKQLDFDSYMLPTGDLPPGNFRLLEADNRLVVPAGSQVRMLVSAEDVLHSWTVPALGVKMDGVPGRLNQAAFLALRPGVFYGQCSEICGANHSFMPVVVEVTSLTQFENWILDTLGKLL